MHLRGLLSCVHDGNMKHAEAVEIYLANILAVL